MVIYNEDIKNIQRYDDLSKDQANQLINNILFSKSNNINDLIDKDLMEVIKNSYP